MVRQYNEEPYAPCIEGCGRQRTGVSYRCWQHDRNLKAYGDPHGRRITKSELRRDRDNIPCQSTPGSTLSMAG